MAQVTPAQFRANFPAFASAQPYTNELIQFWLTDAYNNMNAPGWGTNLDTYAQLRAAHFLSIEGQAILAAQRGAVPGQATGMVSSKSAGPISVSYDTATAAMKEGGADTWNATTYGQRYWRKARMVGAGGAQLMGGWVLGGPPVGFQG